MKSRKNRIPPDPLNRALHFLSFRARSEKEIKDFLAKKDIHENKIKNTIHKLQELSFIDDESFAIQWVNDMQKKGKSKFIIKGELLFKGIEKDIIDKLLDSAKDDYTTAKDLIEKKYRRFEKYKGQEYFQKTSSFLQRKGFNWEIIKKVLNEQLKN